MPADTLMLSMVAAVVTLFTTLGGLGLLALLLHAERKQTDELEKLRGE
jgi:hypothetical protein